MSELLTLGLILLTIVYMALVVAYNEGKKRGAKDALECTKDVMKGAKPWKC